MDGICAASIGIDFALIRADDVIRRAYDIVQSYGGCIA